MTAPSRLGDLLRVVHTLQPDADQLVLLGELLPEADAVAVAAARPTVRPPTSAPSTRFAPSGRSGRPSDPTSRARRTWTGRQRDWRDKRAARPTPPIWATTGRWLAVIVLAALSVLVVAGRFDGRAWLVIAMAFAAPRLGALVGRSWSAWWHSSQHHATGIYDRPGDGQRLPDGTVPPSGTGVSLARARWTPPPPSRPLVQPGQQRAVATLLAGRLAPGELDLAATVRELAMRRPLTEVPRRLRWSTSLGVHLHVDRGPALQPFHHDVDQLRRALLSIASDHAVIELGFDGDPCQVSWPRRIVGGRRPADLADHLPVAGTPVLVLTDLGIAVPQSGVPAEPADFLDHHALVTGAGCTVHYLVPYPPERWPPALDGLPILYWGDDLGATEVLAGVKVRARVR